MAKTLVIIDGKEKLIDETLVPVLKNTASPQLARSSLYKTEIYSRMTDEELAAFDTAMEASDTRSRLMWRDCLQVEATHPFFVTLKAQITTAFGDQRAGEILSLVL